MILEVSNALSFFIGKNIFMLEYFIIIIMV